ncbi:MAG: hypothetical protein PW788_10845 [Micavibrio sp.]|nr:hypothetical protein [Micavibrio sp.]
MFKDKVSFGIFLASIILAGFLQLRKYKKSVAAAVAAGKPAESARKTFGPREVLALLVIGVWVFSLFGPLFVPNDAWRDFGFGACCALDIWAFLYGLKRYQTGAWKETPNMTPLKAKLGVFCIPLVAFFIFWGALVTNSGVMAAEFFGTPGKLALKVHKKHTHDKFGDHYCVTADAFKNAYPVPMFRSFCGLDAEAYDALPDDVFSAEFTTLNGPLGFVAQDFKEVF